MDLERQIKCAARELALRKKVYPRWVQAQHMRQDQADDEIEAMAAILETLRALKETSQGELF